MTPGKTLHQPHKLLLVLPVAELEYVLPGCLAPLKFMVLWREQGPMSARVSPLRT
jgi:hypothetical protein